MVPEASLSTAALMVTADELIGSVAAVQETVVVVIVQSSVSGASIDVRGQPRGGGGDPGLVGQDRAQTIVPDCL